jgi:hypothetical protein
MKRGERRLIKTGVLFVPMIIALAAGATSVQATEQVLDGTWKFPEPWPQ